MESARLRMLGGRAVPLLKLEEGEEAIIVSDLHLGFRHKGKFLTRFEELERFLKWLAERGRASLVVLLGDIFELWSARVRNIVSTAYAPLRQLAKLDATVLYVAGNHDRVLGRLGRKAPFTSGNLIVASEYAVLECGGRRGILFHGHQLDWKFTKLKWLWRLEPYVYLFSEFLNTLPRGAEWVVAVSYVLLLVVLLQLMEGAPLFNRAIAMSAALLLSVPFITLAWRRVQDTFWYNAVESLSSELVRGRLRGRGIESAAVSRALKSLVAELEAELGRLDFVVFGHTHVPELLVDRGGRVVVNVGSWVGEGPLACTFARVSSRGVKLARWSAGEELLAETSLPQGSQQEGVE